MVFCVKPPLKMLITACFNSSNTKHTLNYHPKIGCILEHELKTNQIHRNLKRVTNIFRERLEPTGGLHCNLTEMWAPQPHTHLKETKLSFPTH